MIKISQISFQIKIALNRHNKKMNEWTQQKREFSLRLYLHPCQLDN